MLNILSSIIILLETFFELKPELIGSEIMPNLFYLPYQLIICALLLNRIKNVISTQL